MARHFLPQPLLMKTVQSLFLNKLNVLHLHLTDSQSFPLLLFEYNSSPSHSKSSYIYSQDGAFSHPNSILAFNGIHLKNQYPEKEKTSFDVMSLDDLTSLAQFASNYHIKLILELDIPSHTLSWSKSFKSEEGPSLVINCSDFASTQQHPSDIFALDPSNEDVYLLLDEMIGNLIETLQTVENPTTSKDDDNVDGHEIFFHLGGDEVKFGCWESNEQLMKWAKETLDISSGKDLFGYFEMRLLTLPSLQSYLVHHYYKYKKNDDLKVKRYLDGIDLREEVEENIHQKISIIFWQGWIDSGVDEYLVNYNSSSSSQSIVDPDQIIIEPWKCWGNMDKRAAFHSVKAHHRIIVSSCWYLDWDSSFKSISTNNVLSKFKDYLEDMAVSIEEIEDQVMGGEAALWSEHVDISNFECRLFPRLSAVAHHLWGSGDVDHELDLSRIQSLLIYHRINSGYDIGGDVSDQCLLTSQIVHRPMMYQNKQHSLPFQSFASLNVDDGAGYRNEDRIIQLVTWMRGLANEGVIGIGFCELNGWEDILDERVIKSIKSKLEPDLPVTTHPKENFPPISTLSQVSQLSGFSYYHLLSTQPSHPYSLGIVSSLPFTIIEEWTPTNHPFERGGLWVYFDLLQTHLIQGERNDQNFIYV